MTTSGHSIWYDSEAQLILSNLEVVHKFMQINGCIRDREKAHTNSIGNDMGPFIKNICSEIMEIDPYFVEKIFPSVYVWIWEP